MYEVTIIDGDDVLCSYLQHELENAGCRVTVAHDGIAGIAAIKKAAPHLALMGIALPKLSGIEVLQEMRRDPRTERVPVMIMSMVAADDVIQKALQLGVVEYLVKSQHMSVEIVEKALHFLQQGGRIVALPARVAGAAS